MTSCDVQALVWDRDWGSGNQAGAGGAQIGAKEGLSRVFSQKGRKDLKGSGGSSHLNLEVVTDQR